MNGYKSMRQRPRWPAYGAQQRCVALQVMVLHFTAIDAASPAVATGLDRTIPAYAHAHIPTKTTSHWIVLLILPPWSGTTSPAWLRSSHLRAWRLRTAAAETSGIVK